MLYFIGYSSFSNDGIFDASLFADSRKCLGVHELIRPMKNLQLNAVLQTAEGGTLSTLNFRGLQYL